MNIKSEVSVLRKKVERMENYLLLKVEDRDWHGVADAAMDIRELEAKISTLKRVLEDLEETKASD